MNDEEVTVTFLSCFKCGRIIRSTDTECPRCGMKFGPGTLFECPFCAGLVWRNAENCSTCKTDLVEFARKIGEGVDNFSMDRFVDEIIESELENIRRGTRRVACPSCGLMIRGDEDRCPRCEMPLRDAKVDCPVCCEKVPIDNQTCWNCGTIFSDLSFGSEEAVKEITETIKERIAETSTEEEGRERMGEILETAREVGNEGRTEEPKKKKKKKKFKGRKKKGERKKRK